MTPDQISKLPPDLLWGWKYRAIGIAESTLDAALTWGLQVVEERDAANPQRNKWAMLCSNLRLDPETTCVADIGDEIIKLAAENVTAEATIATLTRERDEARQELEKCVPLCKMTRAM